MAAKRPVRLRSVHVRDLLTGSPAVMHALECQRREDGLLARVRDLLNPGARPHCLQATVGEDTLTVTVDAAVWATRLRYLAPELARGLASAGITQVKVRARPRDTQRGRQTAERVARLTPAVVTHLMTSAALMTDAGLAEVFRRLASRQGVSPLDPVMGEPDC
jgi:hypothetical protein